MNASFFRILSVIHRLCHFALRKDLIFDRMRWRIRISLISSLKSCQAFLSVAMGHLIFFSKCSLCASWILSLCLEELGAVLGFPSLHLLRLTRRNSRALRLASFHLALHTGLVYFQPSLGDGFSLESEGHQVSPNLFDSSQYSGRSYKCRCLEGLFSSSYSQVLQSQY